MPTQPTARARKKGKREKLPEPPPVLCKCGCVPRENELGNGYQADTSWHDAFVAAHEAVPNVTWSADAAGVSRKLAYIHRENYPAFRERWDDAKEVGLDRLEIAGYRRAARVSDTLWLRIMAAHRPEYREHIVQERPLEIGHWTPEQVEAVRRWVAEHPEVSPEDRFTMAIHAAGLAPVNRGALP